MSKTPKPLELIPLPNIPIIEPGVDLGRLIAASLKGNNLTITQSDIVIIAQKIVSKAENRFVSLKEIKPSARAVELAQEIQKDPRQVEVILWDTAEIIRTRPGLLIVEHLIGCISANAGLDGSNVAPAGEEIVLRLPADPDASAVRIRDRLGEETGQRPAVLIIDSHGRPWRVGSTGVVIGLAGINPIQDLRGQCDLFGVPLKHTQVAIADQLAAAASLVMGQSDEACPVVIARGLDYEIDETAQARNALRAKDRDLFR